MAEGMERLHAKNEELNQQALKLFDTSKNGEGLQVLLYGLIDALMNNGNLKQEELVKSCESAQLSLQHMKQRFEAYRRNS